jgi:hypothetical protein
MILTYTFPNDDHDIKPDCGNARIEGQIIGIVNKHGANIMVNLCHGCYRTIVVSCASDEMEQALVIETAVLPKRVTCFAH